MARKKYISRPVEVEAVESANAFKVYLPDGGIAFESKERFLAMYAPRSEDKASEELLVRVEFDTRELEEIVESTIEKYQAGSEPEKEPSPAPESLHDPEAGRNTD